VKKTQTAWNLESHTFLGSQTRFEGKTQIPVLPPQTTTSNKTKPTITIHVDNQWSLDCLDRVLIASRRFHFHLRAAFAFALDMLGCVENERER
jgi:hypothetical protein